MVEVARPEQNARNIGFENLAPEQKAESIRYFAAARTATPEAAAAMLLREDINLEELEPQAEARYNLILEPESLNERRNYWEAKNIGYEDALVQWKVKFQTLVSQVTDETRTSAIKSILPQDNQELREKNLSDITADDAMILFRDYSEEKSDIDKFMKRALDGAPELDTLKERLPHLRWVATGFFGRETAEKIERQLLLEAEAKFNPENTYSIFEESLRPQADEQPPIGTTQEEEDEDLLPSPLREQELLTPPVETQVPEEDAEKEPKLPDAYGFMRSPMYREPGANEEPSAPEDEAENPSAQDQDASSSADENAIEPQSDSRTEDPADDESQPENPRSQPAS